MNHTLVHPTKMCTHRTYTRTWVGQLPPTIHPHPKYSHLGYPRGSLTSTCLLLFTVSLSKKNKLRSGVCNVSRTSPLIICKQCQPHFQWKSRSLRRFRVSEVVVTPFSSTFFVHPSDSAVVTHERFGVGVSHPIYGVRESVVPEVGSGEHLIRCLFWSRRWS